MRSNLASVSLNRGLDLQKPGRSTRETSVLKDLQQVNFYIQQQQATAAFVSCVFTVSATRPTVDSVNLVNGANFNLSLSVEVTV
jgi:hypothetical protein